MGFAIPIAAALVGAGAAKKALKSGPATAALAAPPAEPTIDDAARNRDEIDRIRRRRGVLANVFAGGKSYTAPSVGTKALLGA